MSKVSLEAVLLSLESGARPKGGVSADSGEIPSIGGEHLTDDGNFDFSNIKRIPISFYKKMKSGHICPFDILIVKDGATTGKTSFVYPNFPFKEAAVNEHVFCVRVNPEKALPAYICHFLRSVEGQKSILRDFRGATVGGISREFATKVILPLPSLPEQQRIAEILDRAEALRAKRRAALDQLDELKKAIFTDMFGDPVKNPSDLEIVSLENACSEIYRYPTFYGFEYIEKGIPIVRIGNILSDGSLDPNKSNYVFIDSNLNKRFPRTILELNDIVMAVRGDGSTAKRIGMVNNLDIVGANISPNLIRIKANQDVINPIYLFYFLISEYGQLVLQQSITRTAKKTITAENIKKVLMLCPSIEDQNKFAKIVGQIDKIRKSQQQSLLKLNNLFDSLSHEAFTGKLFSHQFFEQEIENGVKI